MSDPSSRAQKRGRSRGSSWASRRLSNDEFPYHKLFGNQPFTREPQRLACLRPATPQPFVPGLQSGPFRHRFEHMPPDFEVDDLIANLKRTA